MIKRDIIYIIQGFQLQNPDGSISDFCDIEVYANSEKEAIEKAKTLVQKSFYRIKQVIEK
jgi:hypothetical protein